MLNPGHLTLRTGTRGHYDALLRHTLRSGL